MSFTGNIVSWFVFSLISLSAVSASADTVYYKLDNVLMAGGRQMKGVFSWVYEPGDFENGTGNFISLEIPWTSHDQDDLESAFDIGKSIEITLPGSTHDDGVDIKMELVQPLTPTTSSLLDLDLSKYEIGGNGFHDGQFLSGAISPVPEPSLLAVVPALIFIRISRRRRRPQRI